MTSPLNWQEFLEQAGLQTDANCLQNPHQEYSLVRVSGSDAESFLHAQLSNSVTGLADGEVRFAAWCNAKGRIWALVRYWKDGDAFILRMPADQVEDTVQRLRMFVLRSDVQLEPLNWQSTQYLGPDAQVQAESASNGEGHLISLPLAWPAYEVWNETPVASDLPELPERLTTLPRILAGQPEVFASQREEWIPQMLNLDKLDGIDFNKGCYPGQEIVAKLHYKGGLKQRMFIGSIEKNASPIGPGDEINDSEGKKLGSILEAAPLNNQYHLTAIIRLGSEIAEATIGGQHLELVIPTRTA